MKKSKKNSEKTEEELALEDDAFFNDKFYRNLEKENKRKSKSMNPRKKKNNSV